MDTSCSCCRALRTIFLLQKEAQQDHWELPGADVGLQRACGNNLAPDGHHSIHSMGLETSSGCPMPAWTVGRWHVYITTLTDLTTLLTPTVPNVVFVAKSDGDPLVLQVWKRYAGTQRMGTCRDPVRARVMVRSPPEVRKASWKP